MNIQPWVGALGDYSRVEFDWIVRRVVPENVHLANEDGTADSHSDRDDRKIHSRKFERLDINVFSSKDVPPQETSQRRAKRRAICTVVDAERHAVHCSPECATRDPVDAMNVLPCLYYAGEKDGGTNIRACKLVIGVTS